jgi:hypothetical protein
VRNTAGPSRWSCLAIVSSVVVAGRCVGRLHRHGEHQLTLTGLFADPFDTDGRGESAGATVGYNHFLRDGLALMITSRATAMLLPRSCSLACDGTSGGLGTNPNRWQPSARGWPV